MTAKKSSYQASPASNANNDRLGFLADIAAFYYEDSLTQSEIGKLIGISTAMVSRFLAEARDKGVVQIKVNYPYSISPALQAEIVQRFGLRTVRILASTNGNEALEWRLRRIGALAARFLQTILFDHAVIAVGWGKTIYEVVQATRGSDKQGVRVVQPSGALGGVSSPTNNYRITQELAYRLGGQPYHLHAPMLASTRTEILAANLPTVQEIIDVLCAGAHHVTLPLDIIEKMGDHVLSVRAIQRFKQAVIDLQATW